MDGLESIKNKFKTAIDNIFQAKSFSQTEFFRLTVWLVQESEGQIELLEYWLQCVYQEKDWKVPLMPMGLLLEQVHRYYGKQSDMDNQLWNVFLDIQEEHLGTYGEKFSQSCLRNLDITQPAHRELAAQFDSHYRLYAESGELKAKPKGSKGIKIAVGIGITAVCLCVVFAAVIFALRNKNQHEQDRNQQKTMEVSEASASDTSAADTQASDTAASDTQTNKETDSTEPSVIPESETETLPQNMQYKIDTKLEEGYTFESFAEGEWWICNMNTYARQGCDSTYTYFTELKKGEKVIVIGTTEENDGWARIYYENGTSNIAYVKLADIEKNA